MTFLMTIEEVKRDLPQVKIEVAKGKVVWARTSGRKCEDCLVTVTNTVRNGIDPWKDWHFAWATVARAVTNNTPLKGY